MSAPRRLAVLLSLDVGAVLVVLWLMSVVSRVFDGPWIMSGEALLTLLVAFELVCATRRALVWLVAGVVGWFVR